MGFRVASRSARRHWRQRSWRRRRLTRRFRVYREDSAARLPHRRHNASGRVVRRFDPFRRSTSADMSRFTIPTPPPMYVRVRRLCRPNCPSTCPQRDAGGLLSPPARCGQLPVQGLGREPVLPRYDQSPPRPNRAGRIETGARHSPLPHDRVVAPQTKPRRPLPGRAFYRQMRRHPPADHTESGGAATRLGKGSDRNRPWPIIGQIELCRRLVPVFRHRRTLSTDRAAASRRAGTPPVDNAASPDAGATRSNPTREGYLPA